MKGVSIFTEHSDQIKRSYISSHLRLNTEEVLDRFCYFDVERTALFVFRKSIFKRNLKEKTYNQHRIFPGDIIAYFTPYNSSRNILIKPSADGFNENLN